ncbi:hypothetical protein [Burkholderia stagnalis]
METSRQIRWEVKLFETMCLPEQGFVFSCQKQSYVCHPSEPVSAFAECLPVIVSALRKLSAATPPEIIHVVLHAATGSPDRRSFTHPPGENPHEQRECCSEG